MTHRFFRTSRAVYDAARAQLDAAFGHPRAQAETCLPPDPPLALGDAVFVALPFEMTEWPEVAPMIANLISTGDAAEIAEQDYYAEMPQEDQP